MKKTFFMVLLSLAAVFAANALNVDEIVGIWESRLVEVPAEEEGMTMQVKGKYTFGADNTVDMKQSCNMTINLGEHMFADFFMTMTGKGTFTVDGDSIMITIDPATAKMNLNEDDLKIRGCEDPEMEEQIHTGIYSQIAPMFARVPDESLEFVLNNVVVEPKKMTVTEDGIEYTYMRKKK